MSGVVRWAKDLMHATLRAVGREAIREGGKLHIRKRYFWGNDYISDVRRICGDVKMAFVVGAYHGASTRHVLRCFPNATVYAFEPDPDSMAALRAKLGSNPRLRLAEVAIGDTVGTGAMHRNKRTDTNSLLPASAQAEEILDVPGIVETVEMVPIQLSTLDEFCAREKVEHIDLVLADIQGFELHLLRGAKRMLSEHRVTVIALEVHLTPIYEGQPSFQQLLDVMGGYGYQLVCLQGLYFGDKPYPRGGNAFFVARSAKLAQ